MNLSVRMILLKTAAKIRHNRIVARIQSSLMRMLTRHSRALDSRVSGKQK